MDAIIGWGSAGDSQPLSVDQGVSFIGVSGPCATALLKLCSLPRWPHAIRNAKRKAQVVRRIQKTHGFLKRVSCARHTSQWLLPLNL